MNPNIETIDFVIPPNMDVLKETSYTIPPFTIEVFNPQLADWIQEAAKGAGGPVDYTAASLITCTAGLIGNSCNLQITSNWSEPAILWGAIIGNPSQNKTPSLKPIMGAIKKYQNEQNKDYKTDLQEYKDDEKKYNKIMDEWQKKCAKDPANKPPKPDEKRPEKPHKKRLYIQDATIESVCDVHSFNQRGLIVFRDELAGWFGGTNRYTKDGVSDRPFWLECYTNGSYCIDRVKYPEPVEIDQLSISIIGGIQPDMFGQLLKEKDDGLLARFLYYWPEKTPLGWYTEKVSHTIIKTLIRRIQQIPTGKNPHTLILEPDAGLALFEFRKRLVNQEQKYEGHYLYYLGKAAGNAGRLALTLTIMDWAMTTSQTLPNNVTLETMTQAIHLVETYFLPMAQRVFEIEHNTSRAKYARKLARYITEDRPTTINKRALYKTQRLFSSAKKTEIAIEELIEDGWLNKVDQPNTSGRKKMEYQINPRLYTLLDDH